LGPRDRATRGLDRFPSKPHQQVQRKADERMSRIYDALRKMDLERRPAGSPELAENHPVEFLQNVTDDPVDFQTAPSEKIRVPMRSRLVPLTDPGSLGAEKFRALATRLEHLRKSRDLRSLQVTSSVPDEGKTLVTANLALTLGLNTRSKVLLVEGDLHKPELGQLLRLGKLPGISHWWAERAQPLSSFVRRLGDLSVYLLPAGGTHEQPCQILRSPQFVEEMRKLFSAFEWVLVDSTPLLPFVDTSLWSQLLDGTLLVVREGVASVACLKKGLAGIDNLNLVGMVLNDAADFEQRRYHRKYYALEKLKNQQFLQRFIRDSR
jgi:protein-tyrosine kinase